MRTKTILAGLSITLLAVPFVTSAATISDLQAEIAGLLAQIQALQIPGSATGSATVTVNGGGTLSGTVVSSSCPNFLRSLSVGSTGSDVSALQAYLNAHGYLSVAPTGYFGILTKAAIGKWQAQSGITTSGNLGFGIFGPLSRAFFHKNCGSGSTTMNNNVTFAANPTSGAAPLNVQFTATASQGVTLPTTINFGDGSSGKLGVVPVCSSCNAEVATNHTYTSAGTYTATLTSGICSCPANGICNCPNMMVVGTATVTVTGTSTTNGAVSFSASPPSGAAPLPVQFTETVPQGMTLATTINFGDGSNGTLGVVPVCSSCNAEAATTHTYTAPGTYTATLTSGMCSCPANGICNCPNMMIVGTATVEVSATSTASNIQQLNAPGSVTLAQNGIAEIRNESFYFTLNSLTASTATIQLMPVGCWNSFPSDTPPPIRCMIAVVPIPPQTLSIGQSYAAGNYGIELTGIANNEATFSITASSSNSY